MTGVVATPNQTAAAASPRGGGRVIAFDLLNITACLCVVAMHCNGLVHGYDAVPAWHQSLVVECLAFWAVPCFFMLSGATLMEYRKRYDTTTFFKKRLLRVLIPYLAWNVIFYLYLAKVAHFFDDSFWSLLATNQIQPTFWFFIPLFEAYLSMPLLSLLTDHKRTLWYGVAVAFVLQAVLPVACKIAGISWFSGFVLPPMSHYIIYVCLGYLLSKTELPRTWRIALYCAALACIVFRFVYTDLASVAAGQTVHTLFDDKDFYDAIPAAALFVLFRSIDWSWIPQKVAHAITRISGCSFGVYLIHYFALYHVFFALFGERFTLYSGWVRLVLPLVLYVVCVAIVLLLKRVPVLRRIVP